MLPTTVTAGPHLIVMLQTLPLSASECHHSGEGVAVGPTRRTPASQRGKREGPRVSAAVRRSPHIGVAAEETPAGTRSTHDEIPPTARWSTGAWPSSSPGLHSRGRSPRTRVVDRLGSRSSWLWTLFTRTHRLIDAERRPPPRSETGVAQRPAAEWIAQCEQEHTKPGHVPTRVCPSAVRAGHGLSSFTVLRNWIAPIPPGNSARGVTQYPCRREVM